MKFKLDKKAIINFSLFYIDSIDINPNDNEYQV